MKVKKYQSNEERSILTALIVNDGVLGRVHARLGNNGARPFQSKWSNVIAKWCLEYFHKYQKAPRKAIEALFNSYAQSAADKEAVELMDGFLSGLSGDYRVLAEDVNEDYLIDKASAYFDRVQLARMADAVQAALETNDVEEAKKTLASYESMNFASTSLQDFVTPDIVKEDFRSMEQEEKLVEFPGPLGKFLSPHFKRGDFVAFSGPSKRGKSYWLLEVVWRAMKQRRRVLYYVLGDMSAKEVRKRFYVRMTRLPLKKSTVLIPSAIQSVKRDERPEVQRGKEQREKITQRDVALATKKLLFQLGRSELPVKFKCEGASVISAGQIEQDVQQLSHQDWAPDVVVVDYADLLDVEGPTRNQEVRHQINATWNVLRRIALRNHCLVVVATQAAATAYNSWVIRKKDFSEDRRKNDIVSGMVGINQTDREKELGVYRLNWVNLRDGKWSERQVVWTAGCLDIACPCIVSSF